MASYKDFLNSFCESTSQEETAKNMNDMVEYKKTIANVDNDMFQAFNGLLTKQANAIGLNDFDEASVKGYLLRDGLTDFNHIRYNESLKEMTETVTSLMKGNGVYDLLNEHYMNMINTSPKMIEKATANNLDYNIKYVGSEPTLEESHFRDKINSGGKRLYHNGDSDTLNSYERVKLQRKAETIDEVLSNPEFKWEDYGVEFIDDTVEEEVVEETVIEDTDDIIDIGGTKSKVKTEVKRTPKPDVVNPVDDVVTLRPGQTQLILLEDEESVDVPFFTEEEKKTQNTTFIPSSKHTIVWE